jgi:hypothetical protein
VRRICSPTGRSSCSNLEPGDSRAMTRPMRLHHAARDDSTCRLQWEPLPAVLVPGQPPCCRCLAPETLRSRFRMVMTVPSGSKFEPESWPTSVTVHVVGRSAREPSRQRRFGLVSRWTTLSSDHCSQGHPRRSTHELTKFQGHRIGYLTAGISRVGSESHHWGRMRVAATPA